MNGRSAWRLSAWLGMACVLMGGLTVQAAGQPHEPLASSQTGPALVERLLAEGYSIGSLRWSPDGKHILFCGSRREGAWERSVLGTVDLQCGSVRSLREQPGASVGSLPRMGWLPDSQHIWISRNWWFNTLEPTDSLLGIHVRTNEVTASPHRFDTESPVALLRDGKRFVSVLKGVLQIYNIPRRGRNAAKPITVKVDQFSRGRIVGLHALDRGRIVVRVDSSPEAPSSPPEAAYVWHTKLPRQLPAPLPIPEDIRGRSLGKLSPTGGRIAYHIGKTPGMIGLFDLSSGRNHVINGQPLEPGSIRNLLGWSPNEDRLATWVSDSHQRRELVHITNVTTGERLEIRIPKPAGVDDMFFTGLVWSPDGTWLAGVQHLSSRHTGMFLPGIPPALQPPAPAHKDNHRVVLINTRTGELTQLSAKANHVLWSPTQAQLALVGGRLRVMTISPAPLR